MMTGRGRLRRPRLARLSPGAHGPSQAQLLRRRPRQPDRALRVRGAARDKRDPPQRGRPSAAADRAFHQGQRAHDPPAPQPAPPQEGLGAVAEPEGRVRRARRAEPPEGRRAGRFLEGEELLRALAARSPVPSRRRRARRGRRDRLFSRGASAQTARGEHPHRSRLGNELRCHGRCVLLLPRARRARDAHRAGAAPHGRGVADHGHVDVLRAPRQPLHRLPPDVGAAHPVLCGRDGHRDGQHDRVSGAGGGGPVRRLRGPGERLAARPLRSGPRREHPHRSLRGRQCGEHRAGEGAHPGWRGRHHWVERVPVPEGGRVVSPDAAAWAPAPSVRPVRRADPCRDQPGQPHDGCSAQPVYIAHPGHAGRDGARERRLRAQTVGGEVLGVLPRRRGDARSARRHGFSITSSALPAAINAVRLVNQPVP